MLATAPGRGAPQGGGARHGRQRPAGALAGPHGLRGREPREGGRAAGRLRAQRNEVCGRDPVKQLDRCEHPPSIFLSVFISVFFIFLLSSLNNISRPNSSSEIKASIGEFFLFICNILANKW